MKRLRPLPIYIVLLMVCTLFLFPFYWVVISSLKSVAGMDLEPPSMYPAERLTVDLEANTKQRIFVADGSQWLRLAQSPDLLQADVNQGAPSAHSSPPPRPSEGDVGEERTGRGGENRSRKSPLTESGNGTHPSRATPSANSGPAPRPSEGDVGEERTGRGGDNRSRKSPLTESGNGTYPSRATPSANSGPAPRPSEGEVGEERTGRGGQGRNRISPHSPSDEGAYYLQLKDGKATQLVQWFADDKVKPTSWSTAELELKAMPVNAIGAKHLAVVAKIVRQTDNGYSELLFTTDAKSGPLGSVAVLKDVPHQDIRFFSAHWDNFEKALKGPEASIGTKSSGFLLFMRNSLFISVMAVLGQILSSSFVAFGFARLNFKGRNALFIVLLATLMLPAQVTLIPLFSIYKSIGWIDSFLPLIVPQFTAGAFNVFLIRQFMLGLPRELDESAEIDGANAIRVYRSIILPNCGPVLIIVGLFTFVASWQDVLGPLIYLDNPNYRTVSLGLEYFRSPYVDNRPLLMAGALLSMIPVACLFLIAQRYIMSGIATTGLKG
ncbi:MAG: ABC transporter permease subunit [Fimbriimonas sp.]|nr:ABC transporter permease subunit [Fimbriimonas sp.]